MNIAEVDVNYQLPPGALLSGRDILVQSLTLVGEQLPMSLLDGMM